ncbi:DUF6391 domain-containing protein [Thermomicrobium sp. 4228-Ro]|uniref:DUF6391 domain-containing protein n=1 Tax=Thermomicrobium sp. 4228-Ro TaxID=2993937 RepID=UPI00224889AB|nr:DUF6391 domain-containing protein [Thermomicrobium sp. 4228-Ro]MCX2727650.1 DUF6391 domain-containing protein [Thermomicrobium sp. 4228-Ro]
MFALFALAFLLVFGLLAATILVGLTVSSLVTLVTAPGQLARLLRDRRLRRNHALEHATINVIEERYGPSRLAGLAQPDGFLIFGSVSPALVLDAAQEGLQRLQRGEHRLAIHPRCGTTLIASQLVLALAFLITLLLLRHLSFLPFLVGLIAALLLGPRLSPLLQRWVTTDARVDDLAIAGLQPHLVPVQLPWMSILVPVPGALLVRTCPKSQIEGEGTFTVVVPHAEPIQTGRYRVE